MDRFDGITEWQGEMWFAKMIIDHVSNTQYNVFEEPGTIVCFTHAVNWTMPRPTFKNARYIGKALIDEVPVYHWIEEDQAREQSWQIWDDQTDKRRLVRIDHDDKRTRRAQSWRFMEFNVGPQDPNLFTLSDVILAQCNAV